MNEWAELKVAAKYSLLQRWEASKAIITWNKVRAITRKPGNHKSAMRCAWVSHGSTVHSGQLKDKSEGAHNKNRTMHLKFMEESTRIRPPIKRLQGVGISASQWLPIGLKSYRSREWKQIHEPKGRTHDTSKWSYFCGPFSLRPLWQSHPQWNLNPVAFPSLFPPPSLFCHPPAEEHMSLITVLLSQHTIKAGRQTLLPGLFLSSPSSASCGKFRHVLRPGVVDILAYLGHMFKFVIYSF